MTVKIKAVYDFGPSVADRYTVYFNIKGSRFEFYEARAMGENPHHPQGFGQWTEGALGEHNGKEIKFSELPEPCQKLVNTDIEFITAQN